MFSASNAPPSVGLVAILLALLFGFSLARPAAAQPQIDERDPSPDYTVRRTTAAVQVDGALDDEAWETATVIPLNWEWLPGDGVPPPVATDVLVTFDAEHLYVAFRADDPEPDRIRAHLMDRDDIFPFVQDDHVGFMIDPFNDERRGFQFRINPLGVQADAIFSELDGVEDFSWDAIWASAGQITEAGFVVEVALPFHQLRFPSTDAVQTWGFEAFRSYPRSVRHRITSHYRDRNNSCLMCQFNKVTGFRGMSAGQNVEVAPTLTTSRTDRRTELPDSDFDAGAVDVEPGVTARWGPSPNFILNGTVNPDFSQVEADVAQLEVNNRFALFFPERRPFFLEGLDFFQTPLQAVFTRTITDPSAGLKATSKFGRHAIGVFAARDQVNNITLPSNQRSSFASLDEAITSGVVRYRRDVGRSSAVGALYTGRDGTTYRNHVGGLDAFLRLSPSQTLSLQVLRSTTTYPDSLVRGFGQPEGAFGGTALSLNFAHQSRHWIFGADYEDLSPDFREDSGFMPRVDVRTGTLALTRRVWPGERTWFSQMDVGLEASRTYDYDGTLTDQLLTLNGSYSGPWQSFAFLRLDAERQRFLDRTYDMRRVGTSLSLKPTGGIDAGLDAHYGDAIDVVNNRLGTSWRLAPSLGLRLGRSLTLDLEYAVQRLAVDGAELFTEQLAQSRVVYHFSVRAFVRAIVQYRSIARNTANYTVTVPSASDGLFTQLLFSYTLNPQSVLFLGYSSNAVGTQAYALTAADRSFFLKLGYAWTF